MVLALSWVLIYNHSLKVVLKRACETALPPIKVEDKLLLLNNSNIYGIVL